MPAPSGSSSSQSWNIKRLLQWTSTYLTNADVEHGRLCAEILLADVLSRERLELYTHFDYCPNPDELSRFRERVKRCAGHEPIQYITGKAHFMELTLKVTPAVLIPRPETELLVQNAIDALNSWLEHDKIRLIDMCTGSGCIAAAIAHKVAEVDCIAVDISTDALAVARDNINNYGLENQITLMQSDLFDNLTDLKPVHMILANPPYIADHEWDQIEPNVKEYEPRLALEGGPDGLDYYRRLIADAPDFLTDDGIIMLEVGYQQGQAVADLMSRNGQFTDIHIIPDQQGHQRVVKARRSE